MIDMLNDPAIWQEQAVYVVPILSAPYAALWVVWRYVDLLAKIKRRVTELFEPTVRKRRQKNDEEAVP